MRAAPADPDAAPTPRHQHAACLALPPCLPMGSLTCSAGAHLAAQCGVDALPWVTLVVGVRFQPGKPGETLNTDGLP